jgi:hypothetical protein
MVRRETARLRSILERALLCATATIGGVVGAVACSSGDGEGTSGDDASAMDVTIGHDAPLDAAVDASADRDGSLWPPGCEPAPPVVYDAAADAPNCAYRYTLPCGVPSFVTSIDPIHCVIDLNACVDICTGIAFPFLTCEVANGFGCDDDAEAFVAMDGSPIVVECDKCTIAGRRPGGLVPPERPGAAALGEYLAVMAHLEAASVRAFEVLEPELRRLGAPAELVLAARRSAGDEVRHARATASLARGRGVDVPPVRVAPRRGSRSLASLAVENAVEGCVRETFGALVARWQAGHAADRRIARTMARIAADETRHAALAWAIAAWAEPRLDARSRRAVRAARRSAVQALRREAQVAPPGVLVRRAGLPTPQCSRALLGALDVALWSRPLSDRALAPG